MNSKEIEILHNILINKENKSKFINSQNYAKAAEARDEERYWERELVREINTDIDDKELVEFENNLQRMNFVLQHIEFYFETNFGEEYLKNGSDNWSKRIKRKIKLMALDI